MNLSGIGGARSVRDISAVVGTLATTPTSETGSTRTTSVQNTHSKKLDSAHFSKASQFLSNLQELKTSDPATFTQVAQDIADKLEAAADHRGGGRMAGMLSDLAAKFQSLTAGGEVSELSPEQQADATSGVPVGVQQYVQNEPLPLDEPVESVSGHLHGPYGVGQLLSGIFEMVEQAVAELPTVAFPPAETLPLEPPPAEPVIEPLAVETPMVEPPATEPPVPALTDAVPVEP